MDRAFVNAYFAERPAIPGGRSVWARLRALASPDCVMPRRSHDWFTPASSSSIVTCIRFLVNWPNVPSASFAVETNPQPSGALSLEQFANSELTGCPPPGPPGLARYAIGEIPDQTIWQDSGTGFSWHLSSPGRGGDRNRYLSGCAAQPDALRRLGPRCSGPTSSSDGDLTLISTFELSAGDTATPLPFAGRESGSL